MFISNGALVGVKTPLSLTNGTSWFQGMPPLSSGQWPSAYAGIYERQLWVYVVVSKLAKATARLPLPVYERGSMDRRRVADDHPMVRLLQQPNPGQSGHDLMLWTSSMFDIYGDAFWLKRRAGGRVVGLYPLHPASMSWDDREGAWTFDNGKRRIDGITDVNLVHFKAFHPSSSVYGLSPLEPLRATLENEWHARNATSSFWQRGARPGLFLKHPSNISEAAQRRLRAQVDAQHSGSGATGSTMLLEEGMEPHVATLTAEEAQYIETRKLNREEVCAAYDVPPPVVHILDRATFSNITEQMRSMYRDTMGSRLPAFEAAIDVDLRQAEFSGEDIYAEFLMDEVLRGDFETRQDALGKATHMTIAEKRRVENLPFIEGTDRIFLNTATMPLDAIDQQAAANQDTVARTIQQIYLGVGKVITTEEARRIVNQAGGKLDAATPPTLLEAGPSANDIAIEDIRTVMGRLGWQKSLDEVDPAALVANLKGSSDAVLKALAQEIADGGDVTSLRARIRAMVKE